MSKLYVGPYTYDIRSVTSVDADGFDYDKWGDVRQDKQVIRLNADAHPRIRLITLVHEMLHCIGFTQAMEIPEDAITQIAPALVSALEDNGVSLAPLQKLVDNAKNDNRK